MDLCASCTDRERGCTVWTVALPAWLVDTASGPASPQIHRSGRVWHIGFSPRNEAQVLRDAPLQLDHRRPKLAASSWSLRRESGEADSAVAIASAIALTHAMMACAMTPGIGVVEQRTRERAKMDVERSKKKPPGEVGHREGLHDSSGIRVRNMFPPATFRLGFHHGSESIRERR